MGSRGEFLMQLGCNYWGVSFIYVTLACTCTLPFVFALNVLCITLLCKNNGLYLLRNFTQERDPLKKISQVCNIHCTVYIFCDICCLRVTELSMSSILKKVLF